MVSGTVPPWRSISACAIPMMDLVLLRKNPVLWISCSVGPWSSWASARRDEPRPREREKRLGVAGVQDLVGLEPALAGDPQADGDVGHAARRMGVRADRAGDAQLARPPHHAPIEVETMRIRIHLQRDAARSLVGEQPLPDPR